MCGGGGKLYRNHVLSSIHFRKSINYRVPLNVDVEDPEEWQKSEQEKIDTAEPLSEDQLAEKEKLLQSGFSDWSRRDFNQFVRAVGEYGRDNMEKVSTEVEGKEPTEVRALTIGHLSVLIELPELLGIGAEIITVCCVLFVGWCAFELLVLVVTNILLTVLGQSIFQGVLAT